jgi:two-component system, cell cycle sensor histidine kinase PleC
MAIFSKFLSQRLNRHRAMIALPMVAIVLVAAGLVAALLMDSAERLNQQQHQTETTIVRSVIKRQMARLETYIFDYSAWDEMYDQFAGKPDPQWTKENVGPYGVATFQVTNVGVISAAGKLRYWYDQASGETGSPNARDLANLVTYARSAIADERVGRAKPITGIFNFDGRPHFLAVRAISVGSDKRKAGPEKSSNALIYLKAIDAQYLKDAAEDFDISHLEVTDAASSMLTLAPPPGMKAAFGLHWDPANGGSRFIADSVPMLAVVVLVVGAMLVALAYGWIAVLNQARDSEIQITKARADAAEETSRSKSLFIANMSHELRTPLNAVIGFSELIKNDTMGLGVAPKYAEYLSDIHDSGQHLLRIVNNLLLYSKIEAGQHKPHIEPLSLADELYGPMRMLSVLADQRSVSIDLCSISPSLKIEGDQQALSQIVLNVVSNAVKFSKPGGKVEIRVDVEQATGMCVMQFIDYGCGIPEKTLRELGNPFVQAECAYSRQHQGTGLGLAISFALAEQMGGKLEIASSEGKGTTVSLHLPLHGVTAQYSSQTLDELTFAQAPARAIA